MAISNLERVGRGLDILKTGLALYTLRELKSKYRAHWWRDGVEAVLRGDMGREAATATLADADRFAKLDIQVLLTIVWENWSNVFQAQLGNVARTYMSELREVHNRWAHQQPFSADDAHRALDTMACLLAMMGAKEQDELRKLAREMLYQRLNAETPGELNESVDVTQTATLAGLKPWREIATPHPDVASGRYQQAEFAADLYQVIADKAEPEYGDPREFFQRTYLTEGLSRLLSRAWARLSSQGGDPVVALQTNFGGGKTHSLLALYHFFGGTIRPQDVPGVETLLPTGPKGLPAKLPKANRAVLVGTHLSSAEVRTKPDGTEIHTLWGEMAWQLGEAIGKAKQAYALIADEDRRGVCPGAEKLTRLFIKYGPALILIDEWVALARQMYGKDGLPGGSFDSNITFAQAIAEAAKMAKNALVVVSIPQSDVEIGGEGGRAALERLQNSLSRFQAVWKPATATESMEIVRCRLFQPITDRAARDVVCRAFSEMYRANRAEFPKECREAAYESRLCSTYPIHPELFYRLYEDWSTLERFQRTRGVLRMMAAIIHELWVREDRSLLIMPGMLPLDSVPVRFEATRYLPEGWGAVLDWDIDGLSSRPLLLDHDDPNLGRYSAARRVARTVFVGSAPLVSAQHVRGLEEVHIKLGCVQPGETSAVFGDALRRISEELTYLYSDGSRYWYDAHPTIARLARGRAVQFKAEMVENEIIRRVRAAVGKERGDLAGVRIAPAGGSDVPDEPECRLVILGPKAPHPTGNGSSKAQALASEILEQRGGSPRRYRNMLLFLAPDSEPLADLDQAVRLWLSWTLVLRDKEALNLDAGQERQATTQIKKYEEMIQARLGETYSLLLVPSQHGKERVEWTYTRLQGGENLVLRASQRLVRDGHLISDWSAASLRVELDRYLGKSQKHLSVKQLWEYLATYLYLPRLRDHQVLVAAIRQGVASTAWQENFAYAERVRDDGRYLGLAAGSIPNVSLDGNSVIVRPNIAAEQIAADAAAVARAISITTTPVQPGTGVPVRNGQTTPVTPLVPPPPAPPLKRFYGSVTLDGTRVRREVRQIARQVIQHLTDLVGANVQVTLVIKATIPEGAPDDVVRTVTENCRTLKFTSQRFEEE